MPNGSYVTERIRFVPHFHTIAMLHDKGILELILGLFLSTVPIL